MTKAGRRSGDEGEYGSLLMEAQRKLGFGIVGLFGVVIALLGLVIVTVPVWGNILLMGFPHG